MNAKTYFRFCLFVPLLVPLPFFLFKGDGGLSALFVGSLIFGIPPYILVYLLPLVFLIEKMTERQMVIGTIFFPILFPLVFGLFWVIVPQFISSITIKLTGTTEWVFIAIVLPASYSMLFLSGNIIRKLIIGEMGLLERRLAAVLCADVKDYSQHMEQDETDTLHRLKTYRDIFDEDILEHRGRIANRAGDSVVAEFGSVINAIKCACNVQQHFKIMNEELPPEQYLQYRIGINLGDVMSKGEDIQGEGV
ncbi:MAG: adenylate/guanylate cyclase domain-containing protein, partial [Gammaproteobacteria bacterium]|nr:adenylate/guanylate cyclase domain-containing protein [Gammaproteobacteria bacterium]